jgi:hypothetical protein
VRIHGDVVALTVAHERAQARRCEDRYLHRRLSPVSTSPIELERSRLALNRQGSFYTVS